MNLLTRKVNSVGFQEKELKTLEDRQNFVGGYLTATTVLDNIYIMGCDDVTDMSLDNLNLVIRYGKDTSGHAIEGYIFGDCYIASVNEEGDTIPLSSEDLRKLVKHQFSARLQKNGHSIMVIDAYTDMN